MVKILSKLKYTLFLILIMTCVACVSSKKKNPYLVKKRQEASKVNTTHIGRNKYYYTPGYKKKLDRSRKDISRTSRY